MSEPIVTFDEKAIKNELRELVRQTVEDTLNGLLEEEADDLVGAGRYERTADREAYRVNGKVFYRRYGKDSFPHDGKQIYLGPGKDFSL